MLKLGRVTKVKVLFLVLVFVFNFDLFKFSATILEKCLLKRYLMEIAESKNYRKYLKQLLSEQLPNLQIFVLNLHVRSQLSKGFMLFLRIYFLYSTVVF